MVKKGTGEGLLRYGIRNTPITATNGERRVGLYPITGGAATADDILEGIKKRCSLNKADIKSVVSALTDELYSQFSTGRACNLEELGIFTPRVALEGTACNADEVKESDVFVGGVSFRPSKKLLKRLKGIKCKLSADSDSSADLSQEALKKSLDEWFEKQPTLTVDVFARFAKLTPCTARRRLKALEKSGAIKDDSTFKGRIMYVKVADNDYWQ